VVLPACQMAVLSAQANLTTSRADMAARKRSKRHRYSTRELSVNYFLPVRHLGAARFTADVRNGQLFCDQRLTDVLTVDRKNAAFSVMIARAVYHFVGWTRTWDFLQINRPAFQQLL
jgi:hypothetical protein